MNTHKILDLLNDNQGVLTLLLFLITILLGWISGIYKSIIRKPIFKIKIMEGPSFYCTFPRNTQEKDVALHKTAICLYINITNVGNISASIDDIHIGYHWDLCPISHQWLKYCVGWYWIKYQTVSLEDFQYEFGKDKLKVYPFLTQKNNLIDNDTSDFLQPGINKKVVIYFEQKDSIGGAYPRCKNGHAHIKLCLIDSYGKKHYSNHIIPFKNINDAKKYNKKFGCTFDEINNS